MVNRSQQPGQCGHPPYPEFLIYAPNSCPDRTVQYIDDTGAEIPFRLDLNSDISLQWMSYLASIKRIDGDSPGFEYWIDVADGSDARVDAVRERRRLGVRCHSAGLSRTSIQLVRMVHWVQVYTVADARHWGQTPPYPVSTL